MGDPSEPLAFLSGGVPSPPCDSASVESVPRFDAREENLSNAAVLAVASHLIDAKRSGPLSCTGHSCEVMIVENASMMGPWESSQGSGVCGGKDCEAEGSFGLLEGAGIKGLWGRFALGGAGALAPTRLLG